MFRFTRKPSSRNHSQYLAKITHCVQSWYVHLVQDVVSVVAAYCDLWSVCAQHNMFRFTWKTSSGSHSQYLGKITHLVKSGYVEHVQDVISVIAAYYDLWGVCGQHNMFRFTRKPSSRSHSQYLAKITHLVQSGYVELVQDVVSVTVCTVHSTHASQVTIYSHNTDNVLYELYVSTLNQVCNFS